MWNFRPVDLGRVPIKKISTKLAVFVVLKGHQPWRQRQAEGEAVCWSRAPSWRSCLCSCCAPQGWVQDAWWAVVKWGGRCVAQSFPRFTAPHLQLPLVGVHSTRRPTPKPQSAAGAHRCWQLLSPPRNCSDPHRTGHTPHSHMAPCLSAPDTVCALTDFFYFGAGQTALDPEDSFSFLHGLCNLVESLK